MWVTAEFRETLRASWTLDLTLFTSESKAEASCLSKSKIHCCKTQYDENTSLPGAEVTGLWRRLAMLCARSFLMLGSSSFPPFCFWGLTFLSSSFGVRSGEGEDFAGDSCDDGRFLRSFNWLVWRWKERQWFAVKIGIYFQESTNRSTYNRSQLSYSRYNTVMTIRLYLNKPHTIYTCLIAVLL